jgi:hypothetical protein
VEEKSFFFKIEKFFLYVSLRVHLDQIWEEKKDKKRAAKVALIAQNKKRLLLKCTSFIYIYIYIYIYISGNTKGGSITVPLTSCLTRLD